MRVNIYAEEMTDRIEIIEKKIGGDTFTALRFYLELPVTVQVPRNFVPRPDGGGHSEPAHTKQIRGPFLHHPGDDDSAAVTFWGKSDLREVLKKALDLLDQHYGKKPAPSEKALGTTSAAGASDAIEERDELVEALAKLVRDDPVDEFCDYDTLIHPYREAVDLLVRHGRVIRDGEGYRWKTKGGGK